MKILQFNTRLAEGGVAGVALDLCLRSLEKGLSSRSVYGYGKGGEKSASHANFPQIIKYTSRLTSAASIALFRFASRDMFGNLNKLYREVTRTSDPLVLHSHVLHSYWLNLEEVVTFCQKVKVHKPDITFVRMLHDHWNVTGRCTFTDGCEGWKTGCQKCPTLGNYPPVKVNKAHQQLPGKRQMFRAMLALGCQFVSPSQHVADAFNSLYGVGRCRIINSGADVATETILGELPAMSTESGRPKIAVMARGLRYDGGTSQQLVRAIAALGERIELRTFDKLSPFMGDNVINHGFESDKRTLTSTLSQMNGLMFNSRVDNYPLILCETLSIGVPVIATYSDAAQEVLVKSGGRTFSEADVLWLMQLKKSDIAQAVFDTFLIAFGQRSRVTYSGQQMLEEYVSFYQNL